MVYNDYNDDNGFQEHLSEMRDKNRENFLGLERDAYYASLAQEYPEEYARVNAKEIAKGIESKPESPFFGVDFKAQENPDTPDPFRAEIDKMHNDPVFQEEYDAYLKSTERELTDEDFAEMERADAERRAKRPAKSVKSRKDRPEIVMPSFADDIANEGDEFESEMGGE